MYNKVIEILNKAVVKHICVYDMKTITPFYDYSVICSVNTGRQGSAAVNYLKKEAEQMGFTLRSASGSTESTWFLVDLNDIVVHIFVGDARERYNLDGMYGEYCIENRE
ncbi:MAG: ribosome silencing factor [Prevotella sp.]|nr:ribosome silencing factor [Staphylococcus sp.]MCM1349969.1 ribosome silencing factor [Prevotella sp.]